MKKVFEGRADEFAHLQFQKFSRGEFKNKAGVLARKIKGRYSISTTPEYSNELVRMFAEKLGEKKIRVSGPIISTRNLKDIPEFKQILAEANVKQFMGVKQFMIDKELSGNEITSMMNLSPLSHFGFSMKIGEEELKIKPKAPKSAKPSTKGEETPKVDFCKLLTCDKEIIRSVLFDVPENFKKAEITHNFVITDIILPKGEEDFAKMREKAKRKGKIIRKLDIDGKKQETVVDFEA